MTIDRPATHAQAVERANRDLAAALKAANADLATALARNKKLRIELLKARGERRMRRARKGHPMKRAATLFVDDDPDADESAPYFYFGGDEHDN